MKPTNHWCGLAAIVILAACGDSGPGSNEIDGQVGVDAGADAAADAGVDATVDASVLPPPGARVLYPADRTQSPISAGIASQLRALASGSAMRPDVFLKVGDSITDSPEYFMGCLGTGNLVPGPDWETNIVLDGHADLLDAIAFYRAGTVPDGGATSCFERDSEAALSGMAAAWATEGSPSPLELEIEATQALYAVVMYGSNDIGWYNPPPHDYVYQLTEYERALHAIVDQLLAAGIIPILTTMPVRVGYEDPMIFFSAVARALAQGHQMPLIDYQRELVLLGAPDNYGLGDDGVHPSVEAYNTMCEFDAAGLHYGYNVRNLVTLVALDRMRQVIAGNAASLDADVLHLLGTGTGEDPYRVDSLPFTDLRDTNDSGSQTLSDYTCVGATAAPGREVVYRLELAESTPLRALVLDQGSERVHLYLLDASGAAAGCLRTAPTEIAATLAAGTYHLVVDALDAGGEFTLVVERCGSTDTACQ